MSAAARLRWRFGRLARCLGLRRPYPILVPAGRPLADREVYRALHAEARAARAPEIDALERECGYAVDRDWLDELALHTQIVIKPSQLSYQHGRLLYALFRRYLAGLPAVELPTVVETGTARGFSALCLARAMADAGRPGWVVTIDVLPHDVPMLWNCIDDHDGPRTRRQLLSAYRTLLARILFLEGDTRELVGRVGVERVHFAFLDSSHTFEDVTAEFAAVAARQRPGDMVVFDDVTPAVFPGVVAAVEAIARRGDYDVRRLQPAADRGYAIATRTRD
jgi:predicted O-methyltransferase YrrM